MKQHKHHKEIKAWADGFRIDWRINETDPWQLSGYPAWTEDHFYRVHPEEPEFAPKKDDLVLVSRGGNVWFPRYYMGTSNELYVCKDSDSDLNLTITWPEMKPHPLREKYNALLEEWKGLAQLAEKRGDRIIPDPTKLQANKAQFLLREGGKIVPSIQVLMPDMAIGSVDPHGRVCWR